MVTVSESFRTTLEGVVRELGALPVPWNPADGRASVDGPVLVLGGGTETDAIDQVSGFDKANPVYLVGASTDHRLGSAAVRAGARDYFALPGDLDALRRTLEREGRERRGATEGGRFAAAERAASGFATIIGSSEPMRRALDQARRVTRHGGVTVLITGETGTGKELLARAIHYEGPRATGPFVEINCAAIPATLLESELFGHEKGAFTGAIATKPGLFELAHGGTLFLDEIGTMPMELQAKLLRALESREIRRVGGQRTHHIEVRVIAATHGDLRSAITRGEFREDLFYRLNVVSLTLPPLRERLQDVEQLAEVFLERLAATYALPVPPLTPALRAALHAHPWPGNVRELRNTIERGLVLSPRGSLDADALFASDTPPTAPPGSGGLPFPADLAAISRAAARAMVEFTGGNKSEAARRLGISRPRLNRLLDESTP
ncbi:MAG: sigma-54 factor interaction protein [Gemmatimonadetes bacterium]|nr:sigma-54 factor interaction protein [Gemmatimonadota bacterium]